MNDEAMHGRWVAERRDVLIDRNGEWVLTNWDRGRMRLLGLAQEVGPLRFASEEAARHMGWSSWEPRRVDDPDVAMALLAGVA